MWYTSGIISSINWLCWEKWGKWICLFQLHTILYNLTHSIVLMHSPSQFISLIHFLSIQFNNYGNIKVSALLLFWPNKYFAQLDSNYIFWCTLLHTSSQLIIVSLIHSKITRNSKVSAYFYFYWICFVRFY